MYARRVLNLFRRHIARCRDHGSRTGAKCASKPPCPVHYEGVNGRGHRIKPQALKDPRTGNGIRDWARANEVIRDLEAPTPVLVAEVRTPISMAIEHFANTKTKTSPDRQRKVRNSLTKLKEFLAAPPRSYQFMSEIKFHDVTDHIGSWSGANSTQRANRELLAEFFKYCHRADYTQKNLGDKLPVIQDTSEAAEPFRSTLTDPGIRADEDELEKIWKALPRLPDEYGRTGQPIALQTEAFVLIMRYTGLDVSTTLNLKKTAVRGTRIMTYRKKSGEEVWTTVPEWVVEKLLAAPHDSEDYFFWSGAGTAKTRASKWFSRLRKLLDLAGLPNRTPHNFRHHFAVELLSMGVPIDQVARLMGHASVKTTEKSYGRWVKGRQDAMEQHLERVRAMDLHNQRMTVTAADPLRSNLPH